MPNNLDIDINQLKDMYPDFSDADLLDYQSRLKGEGMPGHDPLYEPEIQPNAANQATPPMLPPIHEPVEPVDINKPDQTITVIGHQPHAPKPAPQDTTPPNPPDTREALIEKIKQDLIAKYGLDKFNPDARNAVVNQVRDSNGPPNIPEAIGAFSAGIAGYNPISAGLQMLDRKRALNNQALTNFDTGRTQNIQNMGIDKGLGADATAKFNSQQENDPNSQESKLAQALAKQLGVNPSIANKITAAQFKAHSPVFQKIYEQAQANARTKIMADTRKNASNDVGQQTEDRIYAKDYNTYTSTGRNNALAGINKLKELLKEVQADAAKAEKKGEPLASSGGRIHSLNIIGLGDSFKNERFVKHRDSARNEANKALKGMFGGQNISDADRESAAKEFWNDRLNDVDNAKILEQKIRELENNFRSEDKKAQYFGKHKTLKGFEGYVSPSNTTIDNATSNSSSGPSVGDIEDDHIFKGGDPGDQNNWEPIK